MIARPHAEPGQQPRHPAAAGVEFSEGHRPAAVRHDHRGLVRVSGGEFRQVHLSPGRGCQSSSRMVALAWPPPSHMVCRPYLAPVARMWCTSVVMIRAPLPPRGWPRAIAPPFGFSRAGSAPVSASHARGTGAKASLTSKTPMSSIGQAAALEREGSGGDRAGQHDHRVIADDHGGVHPRDRRKAELGRLLAGGDQQGGRAVGYLRAVGRGDRAVLPEGGLELGELVQRATSPHALVGLDAGAVGGGDRGDLGGEPSLVLGDGGLLVRGEAELVELAAAEAPPVNDHFRADPLVRPLAGIALEETGAERHLARGRHAHRHPAHGLDAAGDDHVIVAGHHAGGGEADRLLRGAALPVEGDAGDRLGPARAEHRVPGDVERLLADLANAAPDHVLDYGRVDPGPFGQGGQHMRGQVGRVHAGQAPIALADRRPDCLDDDCVPHVILRGDCPPTLRAGRPTCSRSLFRIP